MASTMNSSELKQGLLKHDNDPMTPIKGKKHALESSETATATPTSPASDQSPMAADVRVIPIKTVGCVLESADFECRVAQSPETVAQLVKLGLQVLIETGAGSTASFSDEMYQNAGARVCSRSDAWGADVVLKIRAPTVDEASMMKNGAMLMSIIQPGNDQSQALMQQLIKKKITAMAMDCIPRVTRAQSFDVLSSMANIAGYRAVIEAANSFGRFMGGQMTAAGRVPPAKVLIVGIGVAGLSALATAKNMGAIVRCFDVRPACREQVQSLGGEFLEVGLALEEGQGGYAKEMDDSFKNAQKELFRKQCADVDIVITTAAIPGKPSPKLIHKEHVELMKPGSVLVDLAAEGGGNIDLTRKNEAYMYEGKMIIGYCDLPSRLPVQSSKLYANNITKFFASFFDQQGSSSIIRMDDEVERCAMVTDKGVKTFPPPAFKKPAPPPAPSAVAAPTVKIPESQFSKTVKSSLTITIMLGMLLGLGFLSLNQIVISMITACLLAGVAGYQAVWGVTPALHTPLMSVTNAISGVTAIGGMLLIKGSNEKDYTAQQLATTPGYEAVGYWLALSAICVSCINIAGGFAVTKRMLDMFRRPNDPPEYNHIYAIPAIAICSLCLLGRFMGMSDMDEMAFVVGSLCCIGGIGGLATQKSARLGNILGMTGVFTGLVSTFILKQYASTQLMIVIGVMAVGAIGGLAVGRAVKVTTLPQTVAAFHSLVGLAAVITSLASYLGDPNSMVHGNEIVHKLGACLGVLIGGITFTGSLVAFAKLHGLISGRPWCLPGKNYINICCGVIQSLVVLLFTGYTSQLSVRMNMSVVSVGTVLLAITTVIALFLGFHLVGSVGGGDMPICITVLNSYSGWALVAEGFMLQNTMLIISGSLIGFSGAILSYIMCLAMNRSLTNVLFGGYATLGTVKITSTEKGEHREITAPETVDLLMNATNIIIVPGYGMAVARAQHAIGELAKVLREERDSRVRFAIHPVAGRMPGQMNVLLAEAGVPYDWVEEMEEINPHFSEADVALVIGANDITNSAAQEIPGCPIEGMPVLEVWKAKTCIYMKRSMRSGYADLDNPVFYKNGTHMLLGDAKASTEKLLFALKEALKADV